MKLKKTVSLILMLTCIIMSSSWCFDTRKTDEKQLAEITQLATKRFIEEGRIDQIHIENGKYTNLTVYPLYDENDEIQHFLIDLEPSGYVYVKSNVRLRYSLGCVWRRFFCPYSDYTIDFGEQWYRYYRNETDTGYDYRDEEILYENSPFQVAGIKEEKRYLLYYDGETSGKYVPAVKRGDKFLNLISMELYDPNNEFKYEPVSYLHFIGKHPFDL